ncbi:PDDEXK family nuclease [Streptomyces lydicus]|uniref:hypothetical protein n=1 Tax=Streptomyces lydicus TaxID=47763 RepID=UPI0036EDD88A
MSIQNLNDCFSISEMFPVYTEQLRVRSEHIPRGAEALDGDMTIEALPTWYGGTTFRSALEAGWAATLDSLNIAWQYEPETITLPSGSTYIPDFWLPDLGTWLEVKGPGVPRIEKAIELGASRACSCGDACTCQWSGGEMVIIGHAPERYNPWIDPENQNVSDRILLRRTRRHGGHLQWSSADGRAVWLTRCCDCNRGSWFRTSRCRACGSNLAGAHGYRSGDTALQFIDPSCRPTPSQTALADAEAVDRTQPSGGAA